MCQKVVYFDTLKKYVGVCTLQGKISERHLFTLVLGYVTNERDGENENKRPETILTSTDYTAT